jgi:hypothetical protein
LNEFVELVNFYFYKSDCRIYRSDVSKRKHPADSGPDGAGFENLQEKVERLVQKDGREKIRHAARISVPTLAAIRSGRFPWRGKGIDSRRAAKWARALTRVARVFGDSPIDWCRAAGLDVTPTISQAVEEETERLERSGEAVRPVQRRELDILRRITTKMKDSAISVDDAGRKKVVVVGVLDYPPFSTGDVTEQSFFDEIAGRIVGTINPNWGIETNWAGTRDKLPGQITELVTGLEASDPVCDFALGLFDTIHRRYRGIDFIPIPGWRVQLSALWLPPQEGSPKPPRWRDIASPSDSTSYTVVVIKDEAGYLYLAGPCRYNSKRLRVIEAAIKDYRFIADAIEEEAQLGTPGAVFVADEKTCLQVKDELDAPSRRSKRGNTEVKELFDADVPFPRYPLAIAFKYGDAHWRELLASSIDNELFGNALSTTATLYARVMARGLFSSPQSKRARSTFQPEFFPLQTVSETEEFWCSVYACLLERVENLIGSHPSFTLPNAAKDQDAETRQADIAWWTMPKKLRLAACGKAERTEEIHRRVANRILKNGPKSGVQTIAEDEPKTD